MYPADAIRYSRRALLHAGATGRGARPPKRLVATDQSSRLPGLSSGQSLILKVTMRPTALRAFQRRHAAAGILVLAGCSLILSCDLPTEPTGIRHAPVAPLMVSHGEQPSWEFSLLASGNTTSAWRVLDTFPERRYVYAQFSGKITKRDATGGVVTEFGPSGNSAQSNCTEGGVSLHSQHGIVLNAGQWCLPGDNLKESFSGFAMVQGQMAVGRGSLECTAGDCPAYSGATDVVVKVVHFDPRLLKGNPGEYWIYTPNWFEGLPIEYLKWGLIINGVDDDITWYCGHDFVCDRMSLTPPPGLIYANVRVNGEYFTLTHPIGQTGDIEVSASPTVASSGDTVSFAVVGVPDSVEGHQVDLYGIRWYWHAQGSPSVDSVRSCDHARVCLFAVDSSGWMRVAANYGGIADKNDSVFVAIRRAELTMAAAPRPPDLSSEPMSIGVSATSAHLSASESVERLNTLTPFNLSADLGDSVDFSLSTSPAVVDGQPVNITSIRWYWVVGADSTPICGTARDCSYPVSGTGEVVATAIVMNLPDDASTPIGLNPPGISVECTPSQPQRGTETTCTATPSGGVTITGWKFIPLNDSLPVVQRSANTTSRRWGGKIVTEGVVTVTAQLGSQPFSGSTAIGVQVREWGNDTIAWTAVERRPGDLDLEEPRGMHQLGLMVPHFSVPVGALQIITAEGPNRTYGYLASAPFFIDSMVISINSTALQVGSDFYNRQPSVRTPRGPGLADICEQQLVTGVIPKIQAHEGSNGRLDANSHVDRYVSRFNFYLQSDAESYLFATYERGLAKINWWREGAFLYSKIIDGPYLGINMPCEFDYFP